MSERKSQSSLRDFPCLACSPCIQRSTHSRCSKNIHEMDEGRIPLPARASFGTDGRAGPSPNPEGWRAAPPSPECVCAAGVGCPPSTTALRGHGRREGAAPAQARPGRDRAPGSQAGGSRLPPRFPPPTCRRPRGEGRPRTPAPRPSPRGSAAGAHWSAARVSPPPVAAGQWARGCQLVSRAGSVAGSLSSGRVAAARSARGAAGPGVPAPRTPGRPGPQGAWARQPCTGTCACCSPWPRAGGWLGAAGSQVRGDPGSSCPARSEGCRPRGPAPTRLSAE